MPYPHTPGFKCICCWNDNPTTESKEFEDKLKVGNLVSIAFHYNDSYGSVIGIIEQNIGNYIVIVNDWSEDHSHAWYKDHTHLKSDISHINVISVGFLARRRLI